MAVLLGGPALASRERRPLVALAVALGFSQGCALCFYVGAGSYFSEVLHSPVFFVHACASFYLPPILVTLAQLLVDRRVDALLGARPGIQLRIVSSSFLVAAMLALLAQCAGSQPYKNQAVGVFGLGSVLGCAAAVLLGSSATLLGSVDPRMVPYLILGQTAAGVYTNVVARALGFEPGCDTWRARAYFGVATVTVLVITMAYQLCHSCAILERTYRRHEELLSLSHAQPAVQLEAEETQSQSSGWSRRKGSLLGFPSTCWSMAACQTLAIALNMSLTPLSNQVAHGEYLLSQELVLSKLLSDFIGRSSFLLLVRRPREGETTRLGAFFSRMGGHATAVWLLGLCRIPSWLAVYWWSRGQHLLFPLENRSVLIWAVWLPLISTGAFSSSWCIVTAVRAAPEERKRETNLLMSFSIYAGFSIGILVALFSA